MIFRYDGDLLYWLRSLNCDEDAIQRVRDEEYTKNDLLEYVTREELRSLGLRFVFFDIVRFRLFLITTVDNLLGPVFS